MYNGPFFTPPYYRNYYSKNYYLKSNNFHKNINSNTLPKDNNIDLSISNEQNSNNSSNIESQKSTTSNNSSSTNSNESRHFENDSQAFINILGIDLYSDDILILCLLLSLYLEGVKDEMLFISLILLLLS